MLGSERMNFSTRNDKILTWRASGWLNSAWMSHRLDPDSKSNIRLNILPREPALVRILPREPALVKILPREPALVRILPRPPCSVCQHSTQGDSTEVEAVLLAGLVLWLQDLAICSFSSKFSKSVPDMAHFCGIAFP